MERGDRSVPTDAIRGECLQPERIEDAIEKLLQSVDRPGDFCTHGRLFAPMPRLEVEGAGALAFPVPEAQIRALIRVAERAPYGKGTKTLVDRSVRDCWQVEPGRVRLAGAAWRKTFGDILGSVAAGLGCAVDRPDARLHKLLIYERGGFFAPHHDTEKADGMVATLSISLPAAHCRRLRDFCKDPAAARRAIRCARTCAPTCTRPSIAAGWTSSTSPNAAAGRSPSCAPRRA